MNVSNFFEKVCLQLGCNIETLSDAKIIESNFSMFQNTCNCVLMCSNKELLIVDSVSVNPIITTMLERVKYGELETSKAYESIKSLFELHSIIIPFNDIAELAVDMYEVFDEKMYRLKKLEEDYHNASEERKAAFQKVNNKFNSSNQKIDVGGMVVGGMIGGTAGAILGGASNQTNEKYTPQIKNDVNKQDYIEKKKGVCLKFWKNSKVYSLLFDHLDDTLFFTLKSSNKAESENNKILDLNECLRNIISSIEIRDKYKDINALLQKASDMLLTGNKEKSIDCINEALRIDPLNYKAWELKMTYPWKISSYKKRMLLESVDAANKCIANYPKQDKNNAEIEVYGFVLSQCLTVMQSAVSYLSNIESTVELYKQQKRINALNAEDTVYSIDAPFRQLSEEMFEEAFGAIDLISQDVLNKHKELASIVEKCADQYIEETQSLNQRLQIYGYKLVPSALKARDKTLEKIQNKYKEAYQKIEEYENEIREIKKQEFWNAHKGLKDELLMKRQNFTENVNKLEVELSEFPELIRKKDLEDSIQDLEKKFHSISIFKRKDRKAIQENIQSKKIELQNISKVLNQKNQVIYKKISEIKSEISKIDEEFKKDR